MRHEDHCGERPVSTSWRPRPPSPVGCEPYCEASADSERLNDARRRSPTTTTRSQGARPPPHGGPRPPVDPPAPRRMAGHPSPEGPAGRGRHWGAQATQARDRDAGDGRADRHRTTSDRRVPEANCGPPPQPLLSPLLAAPGAVADRSQSRWDDDRLCLSPVWHPDPVDTCRCAEADATGGTPPLCAVLGAVSRGHPTTRTRSASCPFALTHAG
jgi:hypothetical protein